MEARNFSSLKGALLKYIILSEAGNFTSFQLVARPMASHKIKHLAFLKAAPDGFSGHNFTFNKARIDESGAIAHTNEEVVIRSRLAEIHIIKGEIPTSALKHITILDRKPLSVTVVRKSRVARSRTAVARIVAC